LCLEFAVIYEETMILSEKKGIVENEKIAAGRKKFAVYELY
jgi:hypothetical protein